MDLRRTKQKRYYNPNYGKQSAPAQQMERSCQETVSEITTGHAADLPAPDTGGDQD